MNQKGKTQTVSIPSFEAGLVLQAFAPEPARRLAPGHAQPEEARSQGASRLKIGRGGLEVAACLWVEEQLVGLLVGLVWSWKDLLFVGSEKERLVSLGLEVFKLLTFSRLTWHKHRQDVGLEGLQQQTHDNKSASYETTPVR